MPATFKRCVIAALLIGSSGVAQASTQGTLGNPSTGTVTIQASVPPRVQISKLTDIDLRGSDPSTDAVNAQNVCVWSNMASRGYQVTAKGSGSADAFTLISGTLPPIPYTVQWADDADLTTGDLLSTNTALTGQVSSAISADCSTGDPATASLIVRIGAQDLQTMPASTDYSGTLTLVVAPE